MRIVSVTFAPPTHIPRSLRAEIIRAIEAPELYDDGPTRSWVEELQEVAVQGTLEDSGYFFAKTKVEAKRVGGDSSQSRYALTLHVNERRKYVLGDVRFANALDDQHLAFSDSELRALLPMKRGDTFSTAKVREGIRALTALYDSRGLIDMTLEPETKNHAGTDSMDLLIRIDEEKPYRIGKVDFFGLSEEAQLALHPQLKSGDSYNPDLVDRLINQNRSLLPADVSRRDVQLRRNVQDGTVDVRFDFWSCPGADSKPQR